MTLPNVDGWLIDFRTADAIFASGSNVRIDHCVDLCSRGKLLFCHHDEKQFKGMPTLKEVFIDDQDCLVFPDSCVAQQCVDVQNSPISEKLFKGNKSAVVLTALAACKNMGVISDHRSPVYNTVYDLCKHFHIPTFSADEYFNLLP